MLRIEVLFDSRNKKSIATGTFEALEQEIHRCLKEDYQDIITRISWGTIASLSVRGAKTDDDNQKIEQILEQIWLNDTWLPDSNNE